MKLLSMWHCIIVFSSCSAATCRCVNAQLILVAFLTYWETLPPDSRALANKLLNAADHLLLLS